MCHTVNHDFATREVKYCFRAKNGIVAEENKHTTIYSNQIIFGQAQ